MTDNIEFKHIFLPSNLMSITRIILAPIIILIMISDSHNADRIALLVLIIAGITDFLDGFLARKLNQVTKLGLILDPLADKILAIFLIVALVVIRDFPLWLVLLVIGRDILIVLAGLFVMGKRDAVPASDIIGKYYFGALAHLMGSYMVSFSFGQSLMFTFTLIFFVFSTINYATAFITFVKHGKPYYLFKGRVVVFIVRALAIVLLPIFYYKLIIFLFL
ncbi:MAG: CDP-alcohol phosphatidyltransferase family protein [candidate division Zixibacteria bacterium]